ncbi:MAG: hypothetical protein P9L95_01280 [Candidatus Tenebribacter mawsonii]|nr:hypothetical protein [Candidatus Tenebribacter mawsonii]
MDYVKRILIIIVLLLVVNVIFTEEVIAKKDIKQLIIGKWEIAANKRVTSGYIIFTEDGKYDLTEKYVDGSGGGTKGGYELNCKAMQATIKLCLGACPGSEWTNRFAIIRILSDDKLEICISSDGNYPSEFTEDKTSKNTMILTRIE